MLVFNPNRYPILKNRLTYRLACVQMQGKDTGELTARPGNVKRREV